MLEPPPNNLSGPLHSYLYWWYKSRILKDRRRFRSTPCATRDSWSHSMSPDILKTLPPQKKMLFFNIHTFVKVFHDFAAFAFGSDGGSVFCGHRWRSGGHQIRRGLWGSDISRNVSVRFRLDRVVASLHR